MKIKRINKKASGSRRGQRAGIILNTLTSSSVTSTSMMGDLEVCKKAVNCVRHTEGGQRLKMGRKGRSKDHFPSSDLRLVNLSKRI